MHSKNWAVLIIQADFVNTIIVTFVFFGPKLINFFWSMFTFITQKPFIAFVWARIRTFLDYIYSPILALPDTVLYWAWFRCIFKLVWHRRKRKLEAFQKILANFDQKRNLANQLSIFKIKQIQIYRLGIYIMNLGFYLKV